MLSFSMSVSNARSVGANNVNMLPPVLAHSNISVRLAAARAVAMAANASLEDRTSITEGGNMTSPKVCTIPLLALVSASKISTVLTRTSGPSAFTTMFAPNSDMISPVTKSSAIIRPGTRWYFKISGRSARAKTPARSSSPSAVTAASKAALFGAKTVHWSVPFKRSVKFAASSADTKWVNPSSAATSTTVIVTGMSTRSILWITPLPAAMFMAVNISPSTDPPPSTAATVIRAVGWRVAICPPSRSATVTFIGTTWYFRISGKSGRSMRPARTSSPRAATAASKALLLGANTVY
mmetsp:Transcript_81682/g.218571  ORF Transcript_81682/g.218571 Transcript_81682/m.218571 type:complete len:295 (-) Transcript_81682:3145-4029(-)